jgi:transposase
VAGAAGRVRPLEQRLETDGFRRVESGLGFWRLSRAGVFEAFFQALAGLSRTALLVQMFDSTVARAHVSAAGAKGGSRARRSAVRAAASGPFKALP